MAHRKVVIGASVAVGVGLAAPIFLTLKKTLSRPTPQELPSLVSGVWQGTDQEGDVHKLQFNNWGMAKYDGPFGKTKGPLKLSTDVNNSKLSTPILGATSAGSSGASEDSVEPVQVVPGVIEIEALLPNGWLGMEGLQLRVELEYKGAERDSLGGYPQDVQAIRLVTQEAQAVLRKTKASAVAAAPKAAAQVK